MIYVFFGSRRAASAHAHESPRVMTTPLIVLALGAIVFSVLLTPAWPWLHGYLTGEPAHFDLARLIQPMLFVSLVLVAVGIGLGVLVYRRAGCRIEIARQSSIRSNIAARVVSLPRKQNVDRRTLCSHGHRIQLRLARGSPIGWIATFWDGLVRGFGGIGQLVGSSQRASTSAA